MTQKDEMKSEQQNYDDKNFDSFRNVNLASSNEETNHGLIIRRGWIRYFISAILIVLGILLVIFRVEFLTLTGTFNNLNTINPNVTAYMKIKSESLYFPSALLISSGFFLAIYNYLNTISSHSLAIWSVVQNNKNSARALDANKSKTGYPSTASEIAAKQQYEVEDSIDALFEISKKRIAVEIERLSKNANLNLTFGCVATLGALTFLGVDVFNNKINFRDIQETLGHYLPRISIVIFVEIFAFFFLRVYKANLSDIKYFNNELTNVEFKFVAMKLSQKNEDLTNLKSTIMVFLGTERNFVLKKDETTIELEKERLTIANENSIIDAIKDVLKSKAN